MDIYQLTDRYFDSWNSHHAASVLQAFGSSGILRSPLAHQGVMGRELADYASGLWRAFPDFFLQTDQPLFGSKKVCVEWVLRGTHRGELFGWSATGRQVTLNGVEVIDCRTPHGLNVRSFFDVLDLRRQVQLSGD